MTKSVIGGFQKIPKKSKYFDDEWKPEKSKKHKVKRKGNSNNFPVDTDSSQEDNSFDDDLEEEY